MKTYSLPELRDMADEFLEICGSQNIDIFTFFDWLARTEEMEGQTEEPVFDDATEAVDLFGVAGVKGVATPAEIAELMEVLAWEIDDGEA